MDINPDDVIKWIWLPTAIIECFGILNDEQITRYFELGCEVKALGRGIFRESKIKLEEKKI